MTFRAYLEELERLTRGLPQSVLEKLSAAFSKAEKSILEAFQRLP